MINTAMRLYDYFTIGEKNAYGQPQMPSKDSEPTGQVKMAINIASQSVQDNILYKDAEYVGLTYAKVDDTYIIQFGNERLKVLYVNSLGRLTQVVMARM